MADYNPNQFTPEVGRAQRIARGEEVNKPRVLKFKSKEEREIESLRKEVESLSENLTSLMTDVSRLMDILDGQCRK